MSGLGIPGNFPFKTYVINVSEEFLCIVITGPRTNEGNTETTSV